VAEANSAISKLIDSSQTDDHFIQVKEKIQTSIQLEREQTKKLTLKVLFSGDGSPTNNVRRIWFVPFPFPRYPPPLNQPATPRMGIFINLSPPFFGSSLITFYGQSLLQSVGIQGDQVTLALASINTGIPIGMALSFFILPRWGRRPVLCWGATALTTLMCVYTGLTTMKNPSKGAAWASVAVLVVFNVVNGISWIWLVLISFFGF